MKAGLSLPILIGKLKRKLLESSSVNFYGENTICISIMYFLCCCLQVLLDKAHTRKGTNTVLALITIIISFIISCIVIKQKKLKYS